MGPRRRLALAGGGLVTAATVLPPVAAMGQRILAVHTLRQMVVLAIAAPLIAYGAAPIAHRWPGPHPVVGMVAFNAALLGAQVPALVLVASTNLGLDDFVQLLFFIGSLLLWWPVLADGCLSQVGKIGYLLVAGVPPTIPGVVLAFARHPLYAGVDLGDQQLAGLLLFGTAKFTLIAGTFLILWRMLSVEAEPADDDDGGLRLPEEPPASPAWLRRLDEELPAEPAPVRRPAVLRR